MYWDVVKVVPESDLSLGVSFKDGTTGKVLFEKTHLTGVFSFKLGGVILIIKEKIKNRFLLRKS
ncbi:hypothetical protein [Crenothrix polyspora]|uniref:Uncharacterized protein n=1 Tax=Crenothrix polyspora TaxID=360316 RepID=A0A1R4HA91_9GAMM|nr:hypothetical protein [Crenothrix polyspora]SJM93097.1 hypothetical protein CRENPOLYSF1_390006 [Crenothrix polyspora]